MDWHLGRPIRCRRLHSAAAVWPADDAEAYLLSSPRPLIGSPALRRVARNAIRRERCIALASPYRDRALPGNEDTRLRILQVASEGIARFGPRRLTLSDVAQLAGVSRPTLYKHFPSKVDLLAAVGERHFDRFKAGMAVQIHGLRGKARLDAALVYIAEFQGANPIMGVAALEPGFFLEQLELTLPVIEAALLPHFTSQRRTEPAARDLAGVVARLTVSHTLFPDPDPDAFLRELRTAARLV